MPSERSKTCAVKAQHTYTISVEQSAQGQSKLPPLMSSILMECPHLSDAAKVAKPIAIRSGRRSTSSLTISVQRQTNSPIPSESEKLICQVKGCDVGVSLWCCCLCGEIACGRYAKAHMKQHYEQKNEHSVCLDISTYAVYCYKCDEYVVNDSDSKSVQHLRGHFQRSDPSFHLRDIENEKEDTRKRSGSGHMSHGGYKKRKPAHPKTVGLRNLGNTCFMNAVLQSLNNIPEFSKFIQKLPSLDKIQQKQPKHSSKGENAKPKAAVGISTRSNLEHCDNVLLVEEFRKTLVELRQSKTALSPASLFAVIWKVVPTFRGYQQQDAHEFMRYLLDRLHQELLTLLPPNSFSLPRTSLAGVKNSVVTAIFGGVLQSEVHCLECKMNSVKHDPFLDLSLDIPLIKPKPTSTHDGDTIPEVRPCTIKDCLRSFTDTEELADSERYTCGHCKKRQRSTKKFSIRRLPTVLCLHLKRFRWSAYLRTKIETYVEFPTTGLDMSSYQLNHVRRTRENTGSTEYDLAAVVVHHGSGAGSGHYTSYVTHDNIWYHFNDSSVTVCSEETVAKSKAYILFYVQRELKL